MDGYQGMSQMQLQTKGNHYQEKGNQTLTNGMPHKLIPNITYCSLEIAMLEA